MKDFDGWNEQKKRLERFGRESLDFRESEVWWCAFGVNIGHEQDGKHGVYERPALIIKKFNATTAWVIPLSSKPKQGNFYHSVSVDGETQSLLLSQMRLVSVKRLRRRKGSVLFEQWCEVRKAIIRFLS